MTRKGPQPVFAVQPSEIELRHRLLLLGTQMQSVALGKLHGRQLDDALSQIEPILTTASAQTLELLSVIALIGPKFLSEEFAGIFDTEKKWKTA